MELLGTDVGTELQTHNDENLDECEKVMKMNTVALVVKSAARA